MNKGIWKGCTNGRMHIEMTFTIGDRTDQNIAGS